MRLRASDTEHAQPAPDVNACRAASERVVTVRLSLAEDDDRGDVSRLAALSGASPPRGLAMLAKLDGELVAAVGFSDGHTVAHPSRAHPAILAHLRLRRLEARLIGAIWGG